jgi:hypothetical protein
MQTIQGAVRIDGSGPKNSQVEIVDSDGVVLGATTADICGNFCVDGLDLGEGSHKVFARCTSTSGKIVESESINVEVQAAADADDGSWDEAVEHFQSEARQHAEAAYVALVEAAADGYGIDEEYGAAALAATGRTMDDFNAVVQTLIDLNEKETQSDAAFRQRLAVLRGYL